MAMYGRNSSLESRWMGDATIPEVSAFVFMPNGPVRAWCKKKELEDEANLNLLFTFQHPFLLTQILSRLIDHFHSLLSILLPLPDTCIYCDFNCGFWLQAKHDINFIIKIHFS